MTTDSALLTRYFQLKQTVEVMEMEQKDLLRPYKDGMEAIKNEVAARMLAQGLDNIKVAGIGTAFKSERVDAKITDKAAFMEWIVETHNHGLVDPKVKIDDVREWMDKHNEPPPYVETVRTLLTNFRKA